MKRNPVLAGSLSYHDVTSLWKYSILRVTHDGASLWSNVFWIWGIV